VVERSAVNRLVVGSNPTSGAIDFPKAPAVNSPRRIVGSNPTSGVDYPSHAGRLLLCNALFTGRISRIRHIGPYTSYFWPMPAALRSFLTESLYIFGSALCGHLGRALHHDTNVLNDLGIG
jgi:hypothetical protein